MAPRHHHGGLGGAALEVEEIKELIRGSIAARA